MSVNLPRIKALETTLDIVEMLVENEGASVTEVADGLDVAPSTAYNHLQTLVRRRYVLEEGGFYYPSLEFLRVGEYARRRRRAYQEAKSRVEFLAEESGGRTHFEVEEFGRGRYVFIKTGSLAVETFSRVGSSFPLHATAGGKAILAELPEERVAEIVAEGLERPTDHTITDTEALFAELETVRERGVALNIEEHTPGINAVASSVHESDGTVLGALAVSGPAKRFDERHLRDEISGMLLATINELELDLMYS